MAALGLAPAHAGGGLVTLGSESDIVLDMSQTVLTQSGQAGQPGSIAIPVVVAADQTSEETAALIVSAINEQNLPGVIVTRLGDGILIEGASSVSGVGASSIGPIRDLAGNPLKANNPDGTTTLIIFQGEGLDYGDAPAPYQSTFAENGPRHEVVPGLSLGPTATVDADARRDDLDSGDDGATFLPLYSSFQSSVTLSVANTTGQQAYASLWIDFDGNGIFSDTERLINSQPLAPGQTTVSFTVPRSTSDGTGPARAVLGDSYARVRLSTSSTAVANSFGAAPDGEVEDHRVTILANPFFNPNGIRDDLGNGLDVNADGFVSPIDVLQVINYLNSSAPRILDLADATGLPPFIDVNGDGLVSPQDVNIIITYLNSRPRAGGEGEGEVEVEASSGLIGEGEAAAQDLNSVQGSGELTVLASNWAGGLEDVLRPRLAERSQGATSVHDQALLSNNDDSSDFTTFVGSTESGNSIDDFWAGLNDQHEEEDSIADSLADALVYDLLGKI